MIASAGRYHPRWVMRRANRHVIVLVGDLAVLPRIGNGRRAGGKQPMNKDESDPQLCRESES
jgi:hypothetical protein